MSEHTPGPLTTKVSTSTEWDKAGDCAIIDEEGRIIAETFATVGRMGGKLIRRPATANAILFAAAPDMLAACKDALRYIATTGPDDDTSPPIQEQRIMEALEAAIARAEVTA